MATAPTPGANRLRSLPRMKPVTIEWDGRSYQYDPQAITVKMAMAIKLHTGMGLKSWSVACDDCDPVAVQALLWAVKQQNGEVCAIGSLDFSVLEFMQEFSVAMLTATAEYLSDLGDDEDPSEAEATTELTPTSAT